MNKLTLMEAIKEGKKIFVLFLWNERKRDFVKITESSWIEKLGHNLFLARKDNEYPRLYTVIYNHLESKILQTANVSYRFNIVHYQKGKDWYALDGIEEIFLGKRLDVDTYNIYGFSREQPIFLNHKENKIHLFSNGRLVTIPNPCDEFYPKKRFFGIFVKKENGLFDYYSEGQLLDGSIIKCEKDNCDNFYIWDKNHSAWKQFKDLTPTAENAVINVRIIKKRPYVKLYKLDEDLEITLIAEGFAKYPNSGIIVGDTFFPYTDKNLLDFEHPKTGFITKIKKLFS